MPLHVLGTQMEDAVPPRDTYMIIILLLPNDLACDRLSYL